MSPRPDMIGAALAILLRRAGRPIEISDMDLCELEPHGLRDMIVLERHEWRQCWVLRLRDCPLDMGEAKIVETLALEDRS